MDILSSSRQVSRRQLLGAAILAGCTFGPLAIGPLAFAADGRDWNASNSALSISVSPDESFDLKIFGKTWMKSAPFGIHIHDAWYVNVSSLANEKATLLRKVGASNSVGSDKLGSFRAHNATWDANGTAFETSIRVYDEQPMVVFAHSFPQGATGLSLNETFLKSQSSLPAPDGVTPSINHTDVSTAYPAFKIQTLGADWSYLSFHGCMVHPQRGAGLDNFLGGTESGVPLVSYNEQLQTVVVSPLNHFANAVQLRSKQFDGTFVCGLHGLVDKVPTQFAQETIIYAGEGVNQTVFDWGTQLLKLGDKSRTAQDIDLTAKYLGYWTDNGAYYYYNTESEKNYETSMLDVIADLKAQKIPAAYLQLDSWWYTKGKDEGVSRWEPRADVFPHGMKSLRDTVGMPFAVHNRYWSAENEYRKKFQFVIDKTAALPDSDAFWMHIMSWARDNGIILYEQDWLNVAYEKVKALETDVLLSERWLGQMNKAALACGIQIMYCMALPSSYLSSTQHKAVSQIRASTDYCPGSDQWKMGMNAMLAWALGLAPFKDVFWSTEIQEGSIYNKGKVTEPNFELQALVSALSRGAVGPGDKIGCMNPQLIAKTCRVDGLLLKPDKPATTIERCFKPGRPKGEIWDTYTKIGGQSWRFLMVAEQFEEFELLSDDLGIKSPHMVLEVELGPKPDEAKNEKRISRTRLLDLGQSIKVGGTAPFRRGAVPLQYFVLAPTFSDGVAFFGETNKFISVSHQRFEEIADGGKVLSVIGVPGEEVELGWKFNGASRTIKVDGEVLQQSAIKKSDQPGALTTVMLKIPVSGRARVELA